LYEIKPVLMRTLKLSMCDSMAEAMADFMSLMIRNIKILYNIQYGQNKGKMGCSKKDVAKK